MTHALTIWTNASFPPEDYRQLVAGVAPHRLLEAQETSSLNLVTSPPDPGLEQAQIAFGQPDPEQLLQLEQLRWVHLTSAGYTAYDRQDLRDAFLSRGTVMTNCSGVYDEPCAQHALAMMLAFARQLPASLREQDGSRAWSAESIREDSFLLNRQTVMVFGFGAIARRLCQLLQPLDMTVVGVRRKARGDEGILIISENDGVNKQDDWLAQADHVVNLLPASTQTAGYFSATRLQRLKPTAYFYNIGRGSTVDQEALAAALQAGQLAGAYLDVTSPEPLPADHPLWQAPNCHITPHTAGGFRAEMPRLVQHFLDNLARFQEDKPLLDRII